MLEITVPSRERSEYWDESKEEFIYLPAVKEQKLQLEHSLVSVSKWEQKWHKAFHGRQEKSDEETLDYIKCMTVARNVDPETYLRLTSENMKQISDYIEDPMTATTFSEAENKRFSRETITAELIYYWMIAAGIPFECEKWHLNRLIALIRVCNIKNTPPKKMSKREIMNRNAALNASRRRKLGTKG